jgi:hypothetical protein
MHALEGEREKADVDDLSDVFDRIERDCPKFLSELRDTYSDYTQLIFRGVKTGSEYPPYLRKKVRKNRISIDIGESVTNEIDDQLENKFGVRLRTESSFTSKSYHFADKFSDAIPNSTTRPYIFFPIGDYRYFWNTKIIDLFAYLEEQDWFMMYYDEGRYNYDNKEVVENILFDRGKQKTDPDFEEALSKIEDEIKGVREKFMSNISKDYVEGGGFNEIERQEIAFVCDEYYCIDSIYINDVIEWLYGK